MQTVTFLHFGFQFRQKNNILSIPNLRTHTLPSTGGDQICRADGAGQGGGYYSILRYFLPLLPVDSSVGQPHLFLRCLSFSLRFSSFCLIIQQPTLVPYNIILQYYIPASTVLSTDAGELNKTDEELEKCGYNFCLFNQTATGDDDGIPDWQRYTMASIYLVCALLSSVIIVLFVDPLRR